ncbi:hypothetical protein CTAYLR_008749 [Chrysophaeum taylorii]|uniref:Transmembrane protein n=1 Tax=Chrysophaeum taylorii TaxID=2483200 RepID=A0AAD7UF71_9STRA|nr:hypothetical protein CTAYLR_008749 [Chrysophaeum taylorii]
MMLVLLVSAGIAEAFVVTGRAAAAATVRRDAAIAEVLAAAAIASTTPKMEQLPSFEIAKTETREGLYGTYDVDIPEAPKVVDDARSTFKTKAQTKKNRNKYVGIFAVLLVGSFIIPMLQYFWYVRDTPDSLFKTKAPPPPPPPKKKGFFG